MAQKHEPAATQAPVWRPSEKRAPADSAPKAKARPAAPKSPAPVRWELVDLIAVLVVLFVGIYAKDAVLRLHAVSLMPFNGRVATRVAVLAAFYGIQFCLLWFLASRRGLSLRAAFSSRNATRAETPTILFRIATVGLVIGLFLGVEAFSVLYGMAAEGIGWTQPQTLSSDLTAVFGGGALGVVLSAVLVAVVAPLAEELAFRGVTMGALGARWGKWLAILGSAVLYALSHLNAWMFLPTVALGVALGWLAWSRRSLVPAIALHVLYNSAAVVSAFLLSSSAS